MKYIYLIAFLLFSSFAFAQVTWTVECANPKEIVDNSCVGCDKSELFYGIVLNGSDGRVKYLPKHTNVAFKNGTHVFLNGNSYPLSTIDNASTPEEFTALLDCLSGGIVPPPIITTLVNNGDGTATYTNEAAVPTTFQLGWTTVAPNPDGSYTFTYPDGATDEIPADCCPELVANPDGSFTFTAGDGSTIDIPAETVTTLVDNGDGSFSYTNEDGVTVTYSDADTQNTVSSTTGNVEVTEITNPDGTTNYDLDVCKVTDFKLNATGDSLIIDVLNPDGSITGLTTVIPQGGDEDDNDGIGGDFFIDNGEIVDIDSVLIDGIWYVTENRIDKDELLDGCFPPVAVKDCETTPVNTTVILDICTNDYPLDGDIVEYVFKGTFTQGGSYTFDPVTCEFIYDPLNDYVGKDSLEYCVVDIEGDTSNSTYIIIDIIFVPSASNLISNTREDDGADNFILETLAGSEDCDGNSPVTNCVDVTYNLGHLPDPNHDGGSNFATGKYLILEGNSCDPFPSGITKLEGSDGTQYALPADVATIADIYDWDFTNAGGTIGTITGVAKAQTTCEQINEICGDLLAVSYFVDDCATSNVSTDTIRWELTDRQHYMSSARFEAGGTAPFGRVISNKNGERYCNANGNLQSRTNANGWDSDQRHTYYHGTYNDDGPVNGSGSLDNSLPMILVDADDPLGAQTISLGNAPSNHLENEYYYSFSHNSELVPSTAGQLWSFNGTWAIDIGDQNGNNTKSLNDNFLSQTFNDATEMYVIISASNPNAFEFASTFTRTIRVYEGCGQFGVNEVADPIDASRPTIMRPDLSGFVEITSLFSPQGNFTRTSLDNMQKYCGQCLTIQGITEVTFTEGPYIGETFIIENVEQTVLSHYR